MDFVDLSRAEALRALPQYLEAAAGRAMGRKDSYPPAAGYDEARDAVAAYLADRWYEPVVREQVIVTAGATVAMASAVLALTTPGAGILLPLPGYPGPRRCINALGRRAIDYDPAQLPLPSVLDGGEAEAIVVINPENPQGRVLALDHMTRLAEACAARKLALICDSAFLDFTWGGPPAAGAPASSKCVTVGSLGKSLGLPNIRIGWARASSETAAAMARQHWALAMSAGGGNSLIAASLLEQPGWVSEVAADARERLEAGIAAAAGEGLTIPFPQGGLCVCVPLPDSIASATEAAKVMSNQYGVGVRPAPFFSDPAGRWVRLGLAETKEETAEGYARAARFLRGAR